MEEAAASTVITAPYIYVCGNKDEYPIDIDTEIWRGAKGAAKETINPRIPMVPRGMRRGLASGDGWIRPSLISIGPYHYGNQQLQKMQKLKATHAERFIEDSDQDMNILFPEIRKKTPEWKTWYDKRGTKEFSDGQLATIFLLDGCFLLNFIRCCCSYEGEEEDGLMIITNLDLTFGDMANIEQDLFLLENQLPYPLLQLLFENAHIVSSPRMETMIKRFVASHAPFSLVRISAADVITSNRCHLLHCLCAVLVRKEDESDKRSGRGRREDGDDKRSGRGKREDGDDKRRGRGRSNIRRSCRTVQTLMDAGVSFKPSDTDYLTDISFKPHGLFGTTACLKLPTIAMNTSTMKTFLNLIAFESSNKVKSQPGVTSYLCFMDSLIDTAEDVKELQEAGILHNYVGEPKEVAQFFNTVCSNLIPSQHAYTDVIPEIQRYVDRHYNSTMRKWCIQGKQKYCSSPWTCIALIAAIIGLSLTAIQAFTSLFPR